MDPVIGMLLLVFTFIFVQSLRSRNSYNYKLPPGPSPLPIIGNLLEMGEKPHHSLAKLANIHGPIMTLKLGQITTIVISSSDLAKQVLLTHDHTFSNRCIPDAVSILSHKDYSLTFMPISPRWRGLRKICNNQLFANKTLDASQQIRQKKVQELLNDIHQSSLKCEAVEIGNLAFKTAINLLSNTIFSVDLVHSTGKAGEFKELVTKIMKEVGTPNLADFFPILKTVDPQGVKRRTASYATKMMDIFQSMIDQRLNLRSGTGFHNNVNDMLDTLINISQENNQEMDKLQMEHLFLVINLQCSV
ncbi:Cytochrome P450 [Sesbania bispinosa]|nr:Cytochrome P450 [Sesbania bispinosa]